MITTDIMIRIRRKVKKKGLEVSEVCYLSELKLNGGWNLKTHPLMGLYRPLFYAPVVQKLLVHVFSFLNFGFMNNKPRVTRCG